jgi:hypothetical protein
MTAYQPPDGLASFVRVLQHCDPSRAANLLTLAFHNRAHDAVTQYIRLHYAAPVLLAACKQALETVETGRALDWAVLVAAVEQAERLEAPIA